MRSTVTVVLGGQWGDEGKGKFVDLLSSDCSVVCRCQGGSNAGHTVVVDGISFDFHLLPSGITAPHTTVLIGNGVVIHLPTLFQEIDINKEKGLFDIERRIKVSSRAHLVLDVHQLIDGLQELNRGSKSIGTTKRGIGPTYSSKATRNGVRVCDLVGDWQTFIVKYYSLLSYIRSRYQNLDYDEKTDLKKLEEYRRRLLPMVCDTTVFLSRQLNGYCKSGILVEGAQSAMLDIDFGTYPCVTSSNCSIGGVCTGLGIPPRAITKTYGVVKAYTTRVGLGPFPTEVFGEIAEKLQNKGCEYGTTTLRKRRIGWFDAVLVRYAHLINDFSSLILTKLDVMTGLDEILMAVAYKDKNSGEPIETIPATSEDFDSVEVVYKRYNGWSEDIIGCTNYNELPTNAQLYVDAIEHVVGVGVELIGVGKDREAVIRREQRQS